MGVFMQNISKAGVQTVVQFLRLRAARPAVRSEKFFYLDWLYLAKVHGLLNKVLKQASQKSTPMDGFILHPVGQGATQSMGKVHPDRPHQPQGISQR